MKNSIELDTMIHNMGNALFSISSLISSGDIKRAKEKISDIFGRINIEEFNKFKPIDLLMKSKINIMIKNNIRFSSSKIEFPEVDDACLCIIFGNILDNAIYFSSKSNEKIISMKFSKANKLYIYSISNYFYYGKCDNNSQKRKKIGIKSSIDILKKVGGHANFKIKNNKFISEIFLPSKQFF